MEKKFIMKAYESKVVSDSTMIEQAVELAVANALRGKGKRRAQLWKKKNMKIDTEKSRKLEQEVLKAEQEQGKDWIDLIYKRSGRKRPEA